MLTAAMEQVSSVGHGRSALVPDDRHHWPGHDTYRLNYRKTDHSTLSCFRSGWIDEVIATKMRKNYDQAGALLVDLCDHSERSEKHEVFEPCARELRERHRSKSSQLKRFQKNQIVACRTGAKGPLPAGKVLAKLPTV